MPQTPRPNVPRHILPVIVGSQFAGASLWFATNAAMPDLQRRAGLPADAIGDITTAVQLGFIVGTLLFAYFAIADRWSPRRVFLLCALLGAAFNVATLAAGGQLWPLLALRFMTGVFLAGIYPVGMKIASGWFDRDLGKALGFLVGALVLGTAAPHLLGGNLPWEAVIMSVSAIAVAGGAAMFAFVPDGPHLRRGAAFDPRAVVAIFRSAEFRASSFGYFGHMWELYAFWAFLPAYIAAYLGTDAAPSIVSKWTFIVIAAGVVGCIGGGLLSLRFGSAPIAFALLLASGLCCLLSPFATALTPAAMLAFLMVWGIAVAGDSPQFSALNARYAPAQLVGSALTTANCVGFAITVVAIQVLQRAASSIAPAYLFLLLLPGPVFGLLAMARILRQPTSQPSGPR